MNSNQRRMALAVVVSVMPFNAWRVWLYRHLFGYRIDGVSLGWRTVVCVDQAELRHCVIGRRNRFSGPMSVTILDGVNIGAANNFDCGWWVQEERFRDVGYECRLIVRENALITGGHHFDLTGELVVGSGSWIAGTGSQFWTHGAGTDNHNIRIGDGCYVGSAVRFAPGSSVGNNNLVAMGSVVTQAFATPDAMVGGMPAKLLRLNYDWKTRSNLLSAPAP